MEVRTEQRLISCTASRLHMIAATIEHIGRIAGVTNRLGEDLLVLGLTRQVSLMLVVLLVHEPVDLLIVLVLVLVVDYSPVST